ncbi:MAG: porin [Methyloprofundus sp.]|nr:porin [Methyloprofundus sp.]
MKKKLIASAVAMALFGGGANMAHAESDTMIKMIDTLYKSGTIDSKTYSELRDSAQTEIETEKKAKVAEVAAIEEVKAKSSMFDDIKIEARLGKGLKVSKGDASMKIRVRLQPRLDSLDINKDWNTSTDFYLRRARLEVSGQIMKGLTYSMILASDKSGKRDKSKTTDFNLLYAYADYKYNDMVGIRGGKAKLPYSRVSLASSSKQLMVERPYSTDAAKGLFGDYYQANAMLHGGFLDGVIKYKLAFADGGYDKKGSPIDYYRNDRSSLLVIPRLEFSLPGWVEKKMSDSHLGKGQHLAWGMSAGIQDETKLGNGDTIAQQLYSTDLSFHYENITAQAEYNYMNTDFGTAADKRKDGWYLQTGYFIPSLNLEPAFRFEQYNHDKSVNNKQDDIYTAGLNWYILGTHDLKVQVNYEHTEYGEGNANPSNGKTSRDLLFLQAQIYF